MVKKISLRSLLQVLQKVGKKETCSSLQGLDRGSASGHHSGTSLLYTNIHFFCQRQVRAFFQANGTPRGWLCGLSVMFSVEKEVQFIGAPKAMAGAIHSWVSQGNGCTGKKCNHSDNTQLHGVHVRHRRLLDNVIQALDKAFQDNQGNKTFFIVNWMDI